MRIAGLLLLFVLAEALSVAGYAGRRIAVVESGKTRAVLDCDKVKLEATSLSITLTCESGSITLYDGAGRVAQKLEAKRF